MTNDDKALADGLRLLANTARKMSWVGHSPMLAPKVLNKSADRIEALSKANRVARLGLIGEIDSEDAWEISLTIIDGGNVDWDQYPEATRAALKGQAND